MSRPKPPNAGKGRPKGSRNKVTKAFKVALLEAFHAVGGTGGLTAWAKNNQTDFYRLCGRLIPTEIVGPGEQGEHLVKTIQHVHEK